MNARTNLLAAAAVALGLGGAPLAPAAFLIEVDTDGADDEVLTLSPNFAYGGDTTIAPQSVAAPAFGLTGGDSIFGGDGVNEPDTYLFKYDPKNEADNLSIPAGTDLSGAGDLASGLPGGRQGTYAVYAAWPATTGVSGGLVRYALFHADGGLVAVTEVDQNGLDGLWVKLFETQLTYNPLDASDATFTLRQSAGLNTFVSQRAAGVLFEYVGPVPEPTAAALLAASLAVTVATRRRR